MKWAVTTSLMLMVGGIAGNRHESSDYALTTELLPLDEELIVPSTIEAILWEFLSRNRRGEVSLNIVQKNGNDPGFLYQEGSRAAFMFRIEGNVFYYYVDPPDTAEWRILEGRNVFDPELPGVTVDFAYHHWVMFETELSRRELGLVVRELGGMEVSRVLEIARYLAAALPGPSLRVTLGNSLDSACWWIDWQYFGMLGRCPDEPKQESDETIATIEDNRRNDRRVLRISRGETPAEPIEW